MSTSDTPKCPAPKATRATSSTHPDHIKLTEDERLHIAICVAVGETIRFSQRKKWSPTRIAEAYGVSTKTVRNCYRRYEHLL